MTQERQANFQGKLKEQNMSKKPVAEKHTVPPQDPNKS